MKAKKKIKMSPKKICVYSALGGGLGFLGVTKDVIGVKNWLLLSLATGIGAVCLFSLVYLWQLIIEGKDKKLEDRQT